jgi:magnesium transporter
MSAETLLLRSYIARHPDEVARLVEQLAPGAFAEVLAALAADEAAQIAVRAMPLAAALALAELSPELAAAIVLEMVPRDATVIMLRLAAADRERIYRALPGARADMLRTLTEHGSARAGGRMDPRVPMLPEGLPIADVLDRVRAAPEGALDYVYAVDGALRLSGVINLRELLGARPTATLAEVMTRSPQALFADDPLEAIAAHPAWKRLHALPVVDRDGRLLGALRYSAFRAVEAELGERLGMRDTQLTAALVELFAVGVASVTRMAGTTVEASATTEPAAQASVQPAAQGERGARS